MKYYSQAGQDKWIAELFKFKRGGYFIDIGAHDGIELSNTFYLEQELDWKGICIEAGRNNFDLLKENRKSATLHAAVLNYTGKCKFKEDHLYGHICDEGKEMFCLTIEEGLKICKAPPVIDYLSIDIEGGELNALSVFPFDRYIIRALTVEHNAYNRGPHDRNAIFDLLNKNDYSCMQQVSADGLYFEDWYIHNSMNKK